MFFLNQQFYSFYFEQGNKAQIFLSLCITIKQIFDRLENKLLK